MKKLSDLFETNNNKMIKNIKTSSFNLEEGDLFVCIKGVKKDRHKYIKEAIRKKPSGIVVSKSKYIKKLTKKGIPVFKVEDTNKELINICKKFYDNPEDNINIIAITGTDGKTTTAKVLSQILSAGYIGTVGAEYKDYYEEIDNTTPSLEQRYKILKRFVDMGCRTVVMEVSSEAIYRGRMEGATYNTSILTNITEDHLNTHKTIENYINCKGQVFKNTKGITILNRDDKHYKDIKKYCKKSNIKTYGYNKNSTLRIIKDSQSIEKNIFEIEYKDKRYKLESNLIGKYNVYNLSAVILYLLENGYKISDIKKNIKHIPKVPGRFEVFKTKKDSYCILDYAHTTNGLKSVLTLLNDIKKNKIITVTGSAGGREKQKRKEMGKVVLSLSDKVIFTMDDPRYENPKSIAKQMINKEKTNNYEIIIDRKKAIKKAIEESMTNDYILIAGKGRDHYMYIKNKKVPYNDYDEIKKWTKN